MDLLLVFNLVSPFQTAFEMDFFMTKLSHAGVIISLLLFLKASGQGQNRSLIKDEVNTVKPPDYL